MARNGGLSQYCRAMLLYTLFGQSSQIALSPPTTAWLALTRSRITSSDTGATLDEPGRTITGPDGEAVATNYSRASIPLGVTGRGWVESGISSVVNDMDIRFPTVGAPWGTLKYWALTDAEIGGMVLAYGALRSKVTTREGDTVTAASGSISISLDSYDMEW